MPEITVPYKPHKYQKEMYDGRKRRNVYVCHRRMGKTVHEINTLIKSAMITKYRDFRGAYIAPLLNQAKDIAWDYLKYYSGVIPGVRYNETELRVDFPNGARIKLYGADNPDKLRGLFFDHVVMDEVAQMPADLWESVVSHTLRNMHDKTRQGVCDFIGTPMGMNVFFDLYNTALENPDTWGIGFYPITVTNLLTDEEVEEAKRDCRSESKFNREYLCDFSASAEDILIPLSLAYPAVGKHIPSDMYKLASKIIGIDVGGENDAHVICRRQGLAPLPSIKFMEPDHMVAAARMSQAITDYEPDAVFIDQGHGYRPIKSFFVSFFYHYAPISVG